MSSPKEGLLKDIYSYIFNYKNLTCSFNFVQKRGKVMKKVVLITGCNTKIGIATAKKFLQNDWFVIGTDSESESVENNENFEYIQGDLCKKEDREKIVAATVKGFRKFVALVNAVNVEPQEKKDLLYTTEEDFDFAINNNLKGIFFITQLAAQKMISQRKNYEICGRIVNVSSMYAYLTSVDRSEYCISKAGVSTMTKLFAHRFSSDGVVINELRPGMIETVLTKEEDEIFLKDREKYRKLKDAGFIPLDRWGMMSDVADAAYLLCNGNLPYIVGQILDVDGGIHLQRL